MKNYKQILVVAAHPDDELLGCGASLAVWSKESQVDTVILGEGLMARGPAGSAEIKKLRTQAEQANKTVGVRSVTFHSFPDNQFDTVSLLKIVKVVESEIQKHQPDLILTHHGGDLNVDHRLTFEAVLTAARPLPGAPARDILSFEVPSSTEWAPSDPSRVFIPNFFVNVKDGIQMKLKALAFYKDEMKPYPHSRSIRGVEIMAQDWGRKIGVEYAEAFRLEKAYRI
jgi:LmbE family N-acetylglucosaminyl deacetylase